jgi:hypothetical protein
MSKLNLRLVATSLAVAAAIAYLVCVLFRFVFPGWAMYAADHWVAMFPGFSWTALGILLGLIESAAYGFLAGALFVWVYNYFAARLPGAAVKS